MKIVRRCLPAFALVALLFTGCATGHVIEWAKGAPSTFHPPPGDHDLLTRGFGTVVALPVALVWDVVTFPFQWIWDVYPYGSEIRPGEESQ
jgi:hypothetical protein